MSQLRNQLKIDEMIRISVKIENLKGGHKIGTRKETLFYYFQEFPTQVTWTDKIDENLSIAVYGGGRL